MDRLLAINDNLEARVTALESQMVNTRQDISIKKKSSSSIYWQTALQSMVTAQQTEVVAVQKEVATVDSHLIQVTLTHLPGSL